MIDNTSKVTYLPDSPVPPGETLRETLESLGMKQVELAKRMNRPVKTINEIIHGKAAITADTAIQLEIVLGVSSQFWLNLEANYQIARARIETKKRLASEAEYVAEFPYAEMAEWKWVKTTRNKMEKASELLNFFGTTSLKTVDLAPAISYRRSTNKQASAHALTAWLRRGEVEARGIQTASYRARSFLQVLTRIRRLARSASGDLATRLSETCAKCGVAVVYVPHLKKTYVNGATRWLTPEKAMIQLSIRYPYRDVLYFTFFHEAAHILLHGKTERFIDVDHQIKSEKEVEADTWATDFLIDSKAYKQFCEKQDFSRASVTSFAQSQGISPDIVVGRLQHDGKIPHSALNPLRRKLTWQQEE